MASSVKADNCSPWLRMSFLGLLEVSCLCRHVQLRTMHCNAHASVASVSDKEYTYILSCKADPDSTPEVRESLFRHSQRSRTSILLSPPYLATPLVNMWKAPARRLSEVFEKRPLVNMWKAPARRLSEVSEKRPLKALLTKVGVGGPKGD